MKTQSMANQDMTGDVGECKKKGFFEKAKDHKKEIAIGIAIVFSGLVTVFVVKNRIASISAIKSSGIDEVLTSNLENLNNIAPLIPESVEKGVGDIIKVRGHIRNLPEGSNPSISKVELAAKIGCSLEDHQTWVNPYIKAAA